MTKRTQREQPQRRANKDSVAAMTYKGIKALVGKGERKSVRKPGVKSRSFAPKTLASYEDQNEARGISADEAVEREDFFDEVIGTSMYCKHVIPPDHKPTHRKPPHTDTSEAHARKRSQVAPQTSASRGWNSSSRQSKQDDKTDGRSSSSRSSSPTKTKKAARSWDKDGDNVPDFLEDILDNSNRHAVGLRLMDKMFGGGASRNAENKRQWRPYFTYWVTIIQVIIYIVVVATYGFAPVGIGKTEISGEVLMPSLAYEKVSYFEEDNMWIGPRRDDLIHNGAKYSPCIRPDENIAKVLTIDNSVEKDMACCIFNDGSGCFQATENQCSSSLSTWDKWTPASPGFQNRTSGSVCGMDPKYCANPASIGQDIWPDDVSQWPVCKTPLNVTGTTADNEHMTCDLVGRPCCLGIQGECIVTTREYCDFRRGYFHHEAFLCSQVSCMAEVCGMLPFATENEPDQFYRFITSLFLHSGLLSLAITLLFQLVFQRDLEKIIGWWAMAIIYIGGGVAGSIGSAIFIPYYVEAGPSGSQFAVLGVFAVEVIRWNTDEKDDKPGPAIGKLLLLVVILFFSGVVLPQVDNWAHLFGFFFGVLLDMAFRPYKTCCRGRSCSKGGWVFSVIVCLALAVLLLALLVVVFYLYPVASCDGCLYFNCIPFTTTYCDGMSISISRNVTALIA